MESTVQVEARTVCITRLSQFDCPMWSGDQETNAHSRLSLDAKLRSETTGY
jgi:hypothetical protein